MLKRRWDILRVEVRRLVGPFALHPVVLLPGLVLLSLGTAFADTENLSRYNEAWLIVSTQGFVAACITFFALGIPVRFTRGVWRTVCVLALFATTELVRTIVVESTALSRGLTPSVAWPTQILTAIFTGLTIYGVASLTVNNSFQFRNQVANLKARMDVLQATLARTELDANIARREILRSAKATIKSALKKTLGGVSAENTIRSLLDVSDDVVRPLSRQLLYRPGKFAGVRSEPVRTTLQFWEVVNLGSSTQPFRPEATVIVGGMLSLGSAVTSAPYGLGVVAMVALLVVPFSLLWLANRFLTEPIRRLGAVARFFSVSGVFAIVCGIDSLVVGIVNGVTWPLILGFMTYATLLGSLVMWFIATVSGMRRGHAEVIEKFREVNRELEWAVARVNARLWTDQKELSRILHNEVQGVLVATAFKLQRDVDSGNDVAIDVDAIRDGVLEALESPAAPSATPRLEQMLADECERWQGVLNITWDIDEPSLKLLNDDRDSRRVIGDLVGEFLTNAVKHGKAHQVSIWMRPTSRGTMDVSLYNDGAPLPKDRVPGLGTELAYSVSTSVRLPPRKTGVEVRLEIPCEGFGAHAQSASRRTTTVE